MRIRATIQEVYEKVKSTFQNTTNLNALYVGKTHSEESAENRHKSEYGNFRIIAFGSPQVICKAEDFFIKNLKKDFSCLIDNQNEGSAGRKDADMLYISWNMEYNNINQLDEPELFTEPFELVEETQTL